MCRTISIPVGSVLVRVHASDPDPGLEGKIAYRFAESNDSNVMRDLAKFRINEEAISI